MIRNICKDEDLLKIPSKDCTKDDQELVRDLKDTLKFHYQGCVGMAANMIGVSKNMIIYLDNKNESHVLINPVIMKADGRYETEEGCLSLKGVRPCVRYQKIKVSYLNEDFLPRIKTFTGFEAQIIEHEIDHLFGRII